MVCGLLLLIGTSLAGVIGNKLSPISLLNVQSSVYLLAGLFALVMLARVGQISYKEQRSLTRLISTDENAVG
jgi:hypothetical protein